MALTTSSRFTHIEVRCNGVNYVQPLVVRYTLDETSPIRSGVVSVYPANSSLPRLLSRMLLELSWTFFKQINASSAGFRDAAGNSIAVVRV